MDQVDKKAAPQNRKPLRPGWIRAALFLVALMGLLSAAPSGSTAQETNDFQTWTALLGTGKVNEDSPFRYWFDGHARRGDTGTTVIARPAIGVQPLPWLSLWAGYAYVPVFNEERDDRTDEHRAWQQIILSHKSFDDALGLQSRTRFEQRFLSGFDDGLRLRQFFRADYTFASAPELRLVLWDESFWGLNSPGFAPKGFDQNRVFAGPGFSLHPRLRLEVGYLWAVLDRQPKMLHQHALAINFFVSLDWPQSTKEHESALSR